MAILFLFMGSGVMHAQNQTDPEAEKKFTESIQKQVDQYEQLLKLEYWQVFYVDSILTHNYTAMRDESMSMNKAGVSNTDIYQSIADKWSESTYVAFRKVLDDTQWAKYLKTGAGKEKKLRDKRAAAKKN